MKSKLLLSLILAVAIITPAFATNTSLTEKQSASISNSCGTIRQTLKNLQRSDARTRTYFGSIYETVSSKYLKPLNLRLVHNDLSDSTLLELQSKLVEARTAFSDDYVKYSKSLEALIAIDCRLEPGAFYQKLIETREKRATVAADAKTLNNLLTSIVKNTERLKEAL